MNTCKYEPVDAPTPDLGVQWIAYWLGQAQRVLNWCLYRLDAWWTRSRRAAVYFNYAYVIGWTAIVGVCIVLTRLLPLTLPWELPWGLPWALPLALIASARFLEIAVWYVKLLFDATHTRILTAERNLFFLVLDGTVVVSTVGLWLAVAPAEPGSSSTWSAAISTLALNGTPAGFGGCASAIATGIGTFGGLVLLGAGLALIVGLVSKRFTHGDPDEFVGPRYPPKPKGKPWERVS